MACYDNPKEFFGCVNKHTLRAPLGPMFSSDGQMVTDDEGIAREISTPTLAMFSLPRM